MSMNLLCWLIVSMFFMLFSVHRMNSFRCCTEVSSVQQFTLQDECYFVSGVCRGIFFFWTVCGFVHLIDEVQVIVRISVQMSCAQQSGHRQIPCCLVSVSPCEVPCRYHWCLLLFEGTCSCLSSGIAVRFVLCGCESLLHFRVRSLTCHDSGVSTTSRAGDTVLKTGAFRCKEPSTTLSEEQYPFFCHLGVWFPSNDLLVPWTLWESVSVTGHFHVRCLSFCLVTCVPSGCACSLFVFLTVAHGETEGVTPCAFRDVRSQLLT